MKWSFDCPANRVSDWPVSLRIPREIICVWDSPRVLVAFPLVLGVCWRVTRRVCHFTGFALVWFIIAFFHHAIRLILDFTYLFDSLIAVPVYIVAVISDWLFSVWLLVSIHLYVISVVLWLVWFVWFLVHFLDTIFNLSFCDGVVKHWKLFKEWSDLWCGISFDISVSIYGNNLGAFVIV